MFSAACHPRSFVWAIGLFFACVVPGLASPRFTSLADYQVTTWSTTDGLPHPSVLSLAQTPDGYIWCGTEHGLVRFDGVRFTTFDSQTTPELGNGQIRSLFVDRRGTLWITIRDGRLVQYRDRAFVTYFPPRKNELKRTILNLADDKDGALWVMPEDTTVLRFDRGQFATISDQWPGGPSFNVRAGFDGAVWIATASGKDLYHLKQTSLETVFHDDQGNYVFHAPSHAGGYWLSRDGQMGLWQNGAWLWRGTDRNWSPRAGFHWGAEDNETHLWLASYGDGIFGFDTNGVVLHFTAHDGLASDYTRFVLSDREGIVWVATENGLSRIQPALFRIHDRSEGLTADRVTGVCPASEGGLWVGTDGGGVHHFRTNRFSAIALGLQLPLTTAVLIDSTGIQWAATHGDGLYRWNSHEYVREAAPPLADDISALFEDSQHRLWVGQRSLNIIPRRNPTGAWDVLQLPNAEPVSDVRCFAEDEHGGVWAGTCGTGLFNWDGVRCEHFTRTNGLPSDLIWTLHYDAEDRSLWIGTAGGGLARLKDHRLTVCDAAHGLWDNTLCQIFDDNQGWFWFGSHRGVFRVTKASLRQFMQGELTRIHSTSYGLSDGLATLACSSGFQPAGCLADGKLWFPTMRGLASIAPASVHTSTNPPVVRFERVLVDGEPLREATPNGDGAPLIIPPGAHRCEFEYTGLSFTAPEAVEFKYRLKGWEPDWVNVGTSRSATYSQLPPGDYCFLVAAANRDGVWSEPTEGLRFSVLPFFWQTRWFMAACVMACTATLVSIGWLVARNRGRRRLAELTQAHALEHERTRIARDIHDNLGSGLTHIAWLSDLAVADATQPDKVRVHTQKIASEAHQMVQSLDETVWAVSPENDTVESLVQYVTGYANERLQPMDINCHIEAASGLERVPLSAEARHDLYLAVKEALNNLAKHSGAKNARVSIGLQNEFLVVSVDDDGQGFITGKASARGGHGLANLRTRLEQHGGEFICDSPPGSGTHLTFKLPLRIN